MKRLTSVILATLVGTAVTMTFTQSTLAQTSRYYYRGYDSPYRYRYHRRYDRPYRYRYHRGYVRSYGYRYHRGYVRPYGYRYYRW